VRSQFVAPKGSDIPDDHWFLKQLVDSGVRAQIRTGSLLTGQLYVALDYIPKAAKATLDAKAEVPTIPTAPDALGDLQPQIGEIVARINRIKFDEIGTNLQETLKNANAATQTLQQTLASTNSAIQQLSPEAQRTLAEVRTTLANAQAALNTAQGALGSIERNMTQTDAPLQRNANQALIELQRAAYALRTLGDYLQRHPETLLRGKPPDPDVESKR
jgi:paraquat-inducible protein B